MIEVRQSTTYVEWFSNLKDERARARINLRIFRLSQGNPGDVRPVGEGLSELRVDYGPGHRVYLVRQGEAMILLCGGDKSSQARDIRRAKMIANELLE